MCDGRFSLFLVTVFTVSIFLLFVRIQPGEEQVKESRGVHLPSPGLSEKKDTKRAPYYLTRGGSQNMFVDWIASVLLAYNVTCSYSLPCHDSHSDWGS